MADTKGGSKKLKILKIKKPSFSESAKFNLNFNLVFIFLFLNVWDYALNRTFLNGMFLGLVMFVPAVVLWFLNRFKGVVLLTIISIFEFMGMLVFVWEGFELSGIGYSSKSIYWIPFMLVAGLNAFWGLSIYSKKTKI